MRILFDRTEFWSPAAFIVLALVAIAVTKYMAIFPILILVGAVLGLLRVQYVVINEEGVDLNSIRRPICSLKWTEIEQISIDIEYFVGISNGKFPSLRNSKKTFIKIIPYPENNQNSIKIKYRRKIVAAIKRYTSLPIFDSRPPGTFE